VIFPSPSFQFTKFSGNFYFRPEKYGRTDFRPELFWIFQFSNRKKCGRKNLIPKIFPVSNFRTRIFPVREISRPEKVRVF